MALPDCREVWVGGGRPVPERSNRSSDGTTAKYTAVREDQRPDLKKKNGSSSQQAAATKQG